MNWRILLSIAAASTMVGCGLSVEEKTEIAQVTCSVMEESRNMDSAFRVKEMNAARDQLGGEPFIDGDSTIKEAFEYGLCVDLVLDSSYEQKLRTVKARRAQAEKERREELERLEKESATTLKTYVQSLFDSSLWSVLSVSYRGENDFMLQVSCQMGSWAEVTAVIFDIEFLDTTLICDGDDLRGGQNIINTEPGKKTDGSVYISIPVNDKAELALEKIPYEKKKRVDIKDVQMVRIELVGIEYPQDPSNPGFPDLDDGYAETTSLCKRKKRSGFCYDGHETWIKTFSPPLSPIRAFDL